MRKIHFDLDSLPAERQQQVLKAIDMHAEWTRLGQTIHEHILGLFFEEVLNASVQARLIGLELTLEQVSPEDQEGILRELSLTMDDVLGKVEGDY